MRHPGQSRARPELRVSQSRQPVWLLFRRPGQSRSLQDHSWPQNACLMEMEADPSHTVEGFTPFRKNGAPFAQTGLPGWVRFWPTRYCPPVTDFAYTALRGISQPVVELWRKVRESGHHSRCLLYEGCCHGDLLRTDRDNGDLLRTDRDNGDVKV